MYTRGGVAYDGGRHDSRLHVPHSGPDPPAATTVVSSSAAAAAAATAAAAAAASAVICAAAVAAPGRQHEAADCRSAKPSSSERLQRETLLSTRQHDGGRHQATCFMPAKRMGGRTAAATTPATKWAVFHVGAATPTSRRLGRSRARTPPPRVATTVSVP